MASPRGDECGRDDSDGEIVAAAPGAGATPSGGPPAGASVEVAAGDKRASASSSGGAGSELLDSIERLKKQQRDLKAEKKRIATQLKNAEKRRSRLRRKAKLLSDQDLVEVLQMRANTASSSSGGPVAAGDDPAEAVRAENTGDAGMRRASTAADEKDDHS